MLHFQIRIRHQNKYLYFFVDHINITPISEQFRITAKNKQIVLESNRPLFRNKGLKHRRPDWKLVDGQLTYQSGLEDLARSILDVIEPEG